MRKEVKIALVVLGIILLVGIIVGIFLNSNKRNYELNLPQQEKLSSIVIKSNTNSAEVTDNEEIKDIIYVLSESGNGRTTKEESIQDYPVNSDNIVQVNFVFNESGESTVFVYMKNGNYYLEQQYNGIYRINGDAYNSIEKFIR